MVYGRVPRVFPIKQETLFGASFMIQKAHL